MRKKKELSGEQLEQRRQAAAVAHKAGCACPKCYQTARRVAGEGVDPSFPTYAAWKAAQRLQRAAEGACPECGAGELEVHKPGCTTRPTANDVQVDPVVDDAALVALVEPPEWPTILDMIDSEFPDLQGPTWWGWRVYLKVLAALPLDPVELAFAQAKTGRTIMPTSPVRRAYCGAGRRGGKSLIDAVQAVYIATKRRTWTLAPGETSTIPIIAADRTQATVIYNYVKGLLQASPRLSPLIVGKPTKDRITLSNRTQIRIFTASFKTSRGFSLAGFVGDEVAFWENAETSTNPDKEILNAVRPGLMTTKGPMIITSTPYSRRGELWEGFKRYYGVDTAEGIYWKASSLDMNPSLDADEIQAAIEEDPEAAAAEYLGEFRTDLAAFISEELIASVVIPGRGDLPYDPAQKYFAFTDPSGGSAGGDSYTLAIGHPVNDVMVIDCLRESVPPFSPEGVTASHAEACQMYKVKMVVGDHYAAQWPVEAWRKSGIHYKQSDAPKSELYLAALPVFTSGRAEIPDSTRLIRQLRGLERRTARSGKDSVDHAPRGRDDVANVVCGLIALMKDKRRRWGHLSVFGYTSHGTETTFINGSAAPERDLTMYWKRCVCGTEVHGYAHEVLRAIAEHYAAFPASHEKKRPRPTTIEEVSNA